MSREQSQIDRSVSEARVALAPEPSSVRAARGFIGEALAGTRADDCSGDARLLVSELVTNAVLHARSPFELVVRVNESGLRVEVQDRLDRLPVLAPVAGDALAGRGMRIVDQLADRWGAEPLDRGGKIVWFELSCG